MSENWADHTEDHKEQQDSARGRGRGSGFRGRGGRGRGRGRGKTTEVVHKLDAPGPTSTEPTSTNKPPKPQNLSTSKTPLFNDPSWVSELEFEGAGYTVPITVRNKVYPETGTAMDLAKIEHLKLAAMDRTFRRTVSEGMLMYYNSILVWSRLALVERANGYIQPDIEDVLESIQPQCAITTELMNKFLSGIGNVTTKAGDHYYSRAATFPTDELVGECTVPGLFGEITAQTLPYYLAYPAPGICLLRILADMERTLSRADAAWELPEGVSPDANTPNANLLGYEMASELDGEMVKALKNMGFMVEGPDDDGDVVVIPPELTNPFAFHPPLFQYVDNALRRLASKYSMITGVTADDAGSVGLIPFLRPQGTRTARYPLSRTGVYSSEENDTTAIKICIAYAYRVKREGDDWRPFANQPADWNNRRNRIFQMGESGRLNTVRFAISEVDRYAMLRNASQVQATRE